MNQSIKGQKRTQIVILIPLSSQMVRAGNPDGHEISRIENPTELTATINPSGEVGYGKR